jgi:glutamate synthase (NADPH/NADH) small chain
MPGSAREVGHAEEEGVLFDWLAAPAAVDMGACGGAVVVQRMRLGAPDAGGRRAPEPAPGETERLEADLVIGALGFDAEDLPAAWDEPDLAVTPHGAIRIPSRSFATTLEGVFAAGDIVRGASLVVWAVKDGMDAAADIDRWLKGRAPVGARPLLAAE